MNTMNICLTYIPLHDYLSSSYLSPRSKKLVSFREIAAARGRGVSKAVVAAQRISNQDLALRSHPCQLQLDSRSSCTQLDVLPWSLYTLWDERAEMGSSGWPSCLAAIPPHLARAFLSDFIPPSFVISCSLMAVQPIIPRLHQL